MRRAEASVTEIFPLNLASAPVSSTHARVICLAPYQGPLACLLCLISDTSGFRKSCARRLGEESSSNFSPRSGPNTTYIFFLYIPTYWLGSGGVRASDAITLSCTLTIVAPFARKIASASCKLDDTLTVIIT